MNETLVPKACLSLSEFLKKPKKVPECSYSYPSIIQKEVCAWCESLESYVGIYMVLPHPNYYWNTPLIQKDGIKYVSN